MPFGWTVSSSRNFGAGGEFMTVMSKRMTQMEKAGTLGAMEFWFLINLILCILRTSSSVSWTEQIMIQGVPILTQPYDFSSSQLAISRSGSLFRCDRASGSLMGARVRAKRNVSRVNGLESVDRLAVARRGRTPIHRGSCLSRLLCTAAFGLLRGEHEARNDRRVTEADS